VPRVREEEPGGRLGQVAGTGPVSAIPMARLPSGAVRAHSRHCKAGPEELPHPRRQIEGGNVAGHAGQFQAEERPE
jgi:hypothetical protein